VFENSWREILPNSQILTYLQSGVTFAYKFPSAGANLVRTETEPANRILIKLLFYKEFFCAEIVQEADQNDAQQQYAAFLSHFYKFARDVRQFIDPYWALDMGRNSICPSGLLTSCETGARPDDVPT
jgi:hypothetical protein